MNSIYYITFIYISWSSKRLGLLQLQVPSVVATTSTQHFAFLVLKWFPWEASLSCRFTYNSFRQNHWNRHKCRNSHSL